MNARAHPTPLAFFTDCMVCLRALGQHQSARHANVLLLLFAMIGGTLGIIGGALRALKGAMTAYDVLPLAAGVPVAFVCTGVLLHFCANAGLQNSPANAVLVPRLNRLVRRTALLLWSGAMVGAILVAQVLPHGVLVVLGVHLYIVLMVRSPMTHRLPIIIALVASIGTMDLAALWQWLEQPAVLALACAAGLVLGWVALEHTFPRGGERHFRELAAARKNDQLVRAPRELAGLNKKKARARPVYRRLLALDIAARDRVNLMMHVLGPGNHRFDFVLPWALMAAGALGIKLLVQAMWPQHLEVMSQVGMIAAASLVLGLPLGSAMRLAQSLAAGAPEQALFRLSPAAPRAREFNRVLAERVLRTGLFEWAGSLLTMLAIAAIWDAPFGLMLGQFSAMCALLALVGWPLRDHARDPATRHWTALVIAAIIAVGGGVAFFHGADGWLWAPLLAGSALFIRRRYSRMIAAPVAFPARRLQA